jgi:medium-chain acyl-[acyl-carrier-protein] hydrolase
MDIKPVWTEETTVKPYETDFRGEWKPTCFFQGLQLVASHHASHLGYDYHELLKSNIAWVLGRMKLNILRYPLLEERLNVRTWPRGFQQKIFFMRDFFILDQSGRKVAAATSAWILIDVQKRRMLVPEKLNGSLPFNDGARALDEDLERLVMPKDLVENRTVQADYSMVDIMGHVNNTRYVDWVMDCFPFEHHRRNRLAWLQVNYNSEVLPGDQVSLAAAQDKQDPSRWYVQGSSLESGSKAFEAAMGWQPAE